MLSPSIKPEDVLVLLKIAAHNNERWDAVTLSQELGHTPEEVAEAMRRLQSFGFFDLDGKIILSYVKKFLIFDLHDLFPAIPGKMTKGLLTGGKPGTFLDPHLPYTSIWVWPHDNGSDHGFEIIPLSPHCCFACLNDSRLKDLLAVTETLRVVGKDARLWSMNRLDSILGQS